METVADQSLTDIKALTSDDPSLLQKAQPAFQNYNEEQLTWVKLPGGSQNVRKHCQTFLQLASDRVSNRFWSASITDSRMSDTLTSKEGLRGNLIMLHKYEFS